MFTSASKKMILGFALSSMLFAQVAAVAQAQGDPELTDMDTPGIERVVTEFVEFNESSDTMEQDDGMNIQMEAADVAPELLYTGDSAEELAEANTGEFAASEEKAQPPEMNHQLFLPMMQTGGSQNAETRMANSATASSATSSNVQARGDFNNDGYSDLAIGIPFEDNGTIVDAGGVQVLYGTATGLDLINDQVWFQNHTSLLDYSEEGDYFGAALAVGDINNDEYDDLVIGIPGEDVGSITDAGAIQVMYGSASGLTTYGNEFVHQDSPQIKGKAEKDDRFGEALATGDFNSDGYDDVAIGVPYEDTGWWERHKNAGAVHVIRGTQAGLNIYRNSIWTQDSSGIVGSDESYDRFGAALAVGNFDGRNGDDLAIGVPGEDHSNKTNAGAVNIIYSHFSNGLVSTSNKMIHQNSTGILDTSETNDQFGESLTAGDFNNDGADDLAVGIPREDLVVNGINYQDAGAVQVVHGSTTGLNSSNQLWSQATPGIHNYVQAYETFGASVATGDFNGDGYQDLMVGVPNEKINNLAGAGAAHIIYGASSGLTPLYNKVLHQGLTGVAGTAQSNSQFGHAFSVGDYNGDNYDDVMVAVPYANVGSIVNAGAVVVVYNVGYGYSSEEIHQNTPGINGIAEAGDRFSYTYHQ